MLTLTLIPPLLRVRVTPAKSLWGSRIRGSIWVLSTLGQPHGESAARPTQQAYT